MCFESYISLLRLLGSTDLQVVHRLLYLLNFFFKRCGLMYLLTAELPIKKSGDTVLAGHSFYIDAMLVARIICFSNNCRKKAETVEQEPMFGVSCYALVLIVSAYGFSSNVMIKIQAYGYLKSA